MPIAQPNSQCRNLILVLGDQLDARSSAFDDVNRRRDVVLMVEADGESTHVWSHKARIAVVLSAMRHFRDDLHQAGYRVDYRRLEDSAPGSALAYLIEQAILQHKPQQLIVAQPGEYRVRHMLQVLCGKLKVELLVREDRHFYGTPEEFAQHAAGRKQLRMEFFYREMRKKHNVLMSEGQPIGGDWNYDSSNRKAFGKQGPGEVPEPVRFAPDEVTQQVLELVSDRFAQHPGNLDAFDWPVSSAQAEKALADFIQHRLPNFGDYQDAMWTNEPWLFHSRLSVALNLKLLNPRQVVEAAQQAYEDGHAPLNAVEGFIRQILGWREYVRGVYWHFMPDYRQRNLLAAREPLPEFFWTGQTDMHCLSQAIGQTLEFGYAHHIQRLMVTGLYALLLGVDPQQVHEWYLAVYVDAVEWVELPNTLGMSQYADGGIMASKPYIASGAYINRMSNYCKKCRYHPQAATGPTACPFTTLYWDFLARHQERLQGNPRMRMQLKNLDRKTPEQRHAIQSSAKQLRHQGSG